MAPDPWVTWVASQTIGRFKLSHRLGGGYFSHVFEGLDASSGKKYAVKLLKPGSTARDQLDFENEAVLLKRLNLHDGIISCVESGSATVPMVLADGTAIPHPLQFIAMPLADCSVDEFLEDPLRRAGWSWIERLQVFRGAVKGIHQMHLSGIAHRDLKASNCLLILDGLRVKLNDLGRAKDLATTATLPPLDYFNGRGDLGFAAPEFLHLQGGDATEDFLAADLYGLGSLLVELATGQPMSRLALGDFRLVLATAQRDLAAGRRQNLSALGLRYRHVIADIVAQMPPVVREDATTLLTVLCHPVPTERFVRPKFTKDRLARDPLAWVLRRSDIMIRRLEIREREVRRAAERGRTT